LPQGEPTSPALTNLLCRQLDRLAKSRGFIYTRYADDLTFSTTDREQLREIGNILKGTQGIVTHEGLTIHPDKTRMLRQSQQQEVTGIVVNQKLNSEFRRSMASVKDNTRSSYLAYKYRENLII
jgi:RNA-directed DNA polymerase